MAFLKKINSCDLYVFLNLFMLFLGAFATLRITALILLIILLLSVYHFFYVNIYYNVPDLMKKLNILLFMFILYGIYLIFSEIKIITVYFEVYQNKAYLQQLLISLLPIYSFYYFTRKGLLTVNRIRFWIPFFLAVCIFNFYMSQQRMLMIAMLSGSSSEEFTNNTGYLFVSLMPLLCLPFRKKMIQYIYWGITLLFVLLAVKRGAIMIGVCCLLVFLLKEISLAGANKRWKIIILSMGLVVAAVCFFNYQMEHSDYFVQRLENTIEGQTNGRDEIYSILLDKFLNSDLYHMLFGYGANSTIIFTGQRAHNDWLQILSDQGLVGGIIYFIYFISFYKLWNRQKNNREYGLMFTLVFIVCFLRTLFSMSIADYSLFISLAIGYCIACDQSRKIRQSVNVF